MSLSMAGVTILGDAVGDESLAKTHSTQSCSENRTLETEYMIKFHNL